VIARYRLSDGYTLSRLIKGGWHLAGGHGDVDPDRALADMAAFVDAGITTFDCADIYTGVEALIGRFRARYPAHAARLQVHTKFVPDLDRLASIDRAYVESIIDRSLTRLGVEQLDLVQFHWWDYRVPGYVETAATLQQLQAAGKIARLGVTNFDTVRLGEILDAGVRIAAHQLQYSLLDHRPEPRMVELCAAHDIALLCYGTVAGGFLSERWVGQASPAEPLANRSLVKYRLIIEDFGGWALYQALLEVLADIARAQRTDIATVATRVVLDRPGVAAAIVGATNTAHLAAHAGIESVQLSAADRARLEAVLARRLGPHGDVYTLERDQHGPHGRIMKYNLNESAQSGPTHRNG
jgi:aryl-alcohol dehydrogenase-like predicted oxidoreductase